MSSVERQNRDLTYCKACRGTFVLILPTLSGTEEYPCPCCRPWAQGFGGLKAVVRGVERWLIHPARAGEKAIINEENNHDKPDHQENALPDRGAI
jgi:hypothetical protein